MTLHNPVYYASPMPWRLLKSIYYIAHNGNGYRRDQDHDVKTMIHNGWSSKDTLILMAGARNVGRMLVCDLITPCSVMLAPTQHSLENEGLDAGVNYKKSVPGYTLTNLGRKVGRVVSDVGPLGYREPGNQMATIAEVRKVMFEAYGRRRLPVPPPAPLAQPEKPPAHSVPLIVGKRYRTYGGDIVTIIYRNDEMRGYEVVQGDDLPEFEVQLGFRYNRKSDRGRCTGSEPGDPRNIIPDLAEF